MKKVVIKDLRPYAAYAYAAYHMTITDSGDMSYPLAILGPPFALPKHFDYCKLPNYQAYAKQGFFAFYHEAKQLQLLICTFRGTQISWHNIRDLPADHKISRGEVPEDLVKQAIEFVLNAINFVSGTKRLRVHCTGHSLGGYLAAQVVKAGPAQRHRYLAVTFDAPGILYVEDRHSNIHNIVGLPNFVNCTGRPIGRLYVLNLHTGHLPKNWMRSLREYFQSSIAGGSFFASAESSVESSVVAVNMYLLQLVVTKLPVLLQDPTRCVSELIFSIVIGQLQIGVGDIGQRVKDTLKYHSMLRFLCSICGNADFAGLNGSKEQSVMEIDPCQWPSPGAYLRESYTFNAINAWRRVEDKAGPVRVRSVSGGVTMRSVVSRLEGRNISGAEEMEALPKQEAVEGETQVSVESLAWYCRLNMMALLLVGSAVAGLFAIIYPWTQNEKDSAELDMPYPH